MIVKLFKRLLWAIVLVIALGAALVFALPKLAPMEKITDLLQEKVRAQTGRDLAFSGAHFSFWPNIGIELRQVTLSNAPWSQQKSMVSLGKAEVELELLPLLHHHIIVRKFILDQPVIYLETSAEGQRNWDFSQAAAAPAQDNNAAPEPNNSAVAAHPEFDFQFGRIQISKGYLVFINQQKKTSITVEDADLDVIWPNLKSQLQLKGALTYRGKRLTLAAGLDRPLDFFNGRISSGQVSLQADDFNIRADGAFATQGTLLKGDIEAKTPAFAEVLGWARNAPAQTLPFENLSFSGAARLTPGELILKESRLTLDEIKANGDLDMEFSGKPTLFARLSMNGLKLDRFFANPSPSGASKAPGAPAPAGADERGWSTRPLDFSGLKALNADLKLHTQGFSLRGAEVGPSVLSVQLLDGNLHFTSSEATLAGGKFSSDMRLNATTPSVSLVFNMTGVEARPILTAFMHFKKLSGAATAHVTLSAAGDSQKALIGSLEGHGDVGFRNGELQGIDLVKIAKLVQAHTKEFDVNEGATKFVDVAGTLSIVKGIVSNTDMRMKGNVVQASGQGIIDLPKKYIQYKVTPVLLTSSKAPPGLSVPVKIVGPFSNIKAIPDFAATVKNIIKNPSGARQVLKNVRDNLKQNAILQKLLNSGLLGKHAPASSAPPPQSAPPPEAPATPQPVPQ